MAETKEVKEVEELKQKVKALEEENKDLKTGTEKKPKEPEKIEFEKGQKIADLHILGVAGRHIEYDDEANEHPKKQIKFIQLKKETRESWDPRLSIMQYIPTGKIIPAGEPRSMSVEDFKDFVARRETAGQIIS